MLFAALEDDPSVTAWRLRRLAGNLSASRNLEATKALDRVHVLDLVDAAGLPVMARGRGAPLPLRPFVRTLASVKPSDRSLASVRLALTLGELRDGLFPNRSFRPVKGGPKPRDALLHAQDYAIHDGSRVPIVIVAIVVWLVGL